MREFKKVSDREESIASQIIDAAYGVHKQLGPGLLEKIYESCLCHELNKRKLSFQKQVNVPIKYDGLTFENGFRLDILVEDLIICELKAVEQNTNPLWEAQLLSYLRLSGKRLWFSDKLQ